MGTLLEGAVFEIYDKAGNVVDTIKSDRNGRAVSKTLPLSRYTIREIKAPANYSINPTVMTAYLEFNGQIVTFEVQNTSVSTGVSIKNQGPSCRLVPGPADTATVFSQIKNSSNVALDSFYWRDQLPAQVTLSKIVTGSYNQPLSYKVVYKTNLSGDYRTLADNLSTSKVYVLDARPAVLGLAANERVTERSLFVGFWKSRKGLGPLAQDGNAVHLRHRPQRSCQQLRHCECGGCGRPLQRTVDSGSVPLAHYRLHQNNGEAAQDGVLSLAAQ